MMVEDEVGMEASQVVKLDKETMANIIEGVAKKLTEAQKRQQPTELGSMSQQNQRERS